MAEKRPKVGDGDGGEAADRATDGLPKSPRIVDGEIKDQTPRTDEDRATKGIVPSPWYFRIHVTSREFPGSKTVELEDVSTLEDLQLRLGERLHVSIHNMSFCVNCTHMAADSGDRSSFLVALEDMSELEQFKVTSNRVFVHLEVEGDDTCGLEPENDEECFETFKQQFFAFVQTAQRGFTVEKLERVVNRPLRRQFLARKAELQDPSTLWRFYPCGDQVRTSLTKWGFQIPANHGHVGRGLYFPSDCSKSSQWRPGQHRLLICEVAVGRSCSLQGTHRDMDLDTLTSDGFDSVVASQTSCGREFDERVVYHRAQAFPAYVITFNTNETPVDVAHEAAAADASLCPLHYYKKLDMYCLDDQSLVCSKCVTDDHHGHVCKPIDLALSQATVSLEESHAICHGRLRVVDDFFHMIERCEEAIHQRSLDQQNMVCEELAKIHDMIAKRQEDLIAGIKEAESSRLKKLEMQREEWVEAREKLKFADQDTRTTLGLANPRDMARRLDTSQAALRSIEDLADVEVLRDATPSAFDDAALTLNVTPYVQFVRAVDFVERKCADILLEIVIKDNRQRIRKGEKPVPLINAVAAALLIDIARINATAIAGTSDKAGTAKGGAIVHLRVSAPPPFGARHISSNEISNAMQEKTFKKVFVEIDSGCSLLSIVELNPATRRPGRVLLEPPKKKGRGR